MGESFTPEIKKAATSAKRLSKEEEKALFVEYHTKGTSRARKKAISDQIISMHIPLAMSAAAKWAKKSSKHTVHDLLGEASIGLMQAFKGFKHEKGFRFSTYANFWVRAAIQNFIYANASSIKGATSGFQKFLFDNYGKIKRQVERDNPETPQSLIDVLVAEKLIASGYSKYKLDKTLQEIAAYKISTQNMASVDKPVGDGEGASPLIDLIADDGAKSAEELTIDDETARLGRQFLDSAKGRLKEREWDILYRRRLKEPKDTLEVLGQEYDLTRERVRQIEVRAFQKLSDLATNRRFLSGNGLSADFAGFGAAKKPEVVVKKKRRTTKRAPKPTAQSAVA